MTIDDSIGIGNLELSEESLRKKLYNNLIGIGDKELAEFSLKDKTHLINTFYKIINERDIEPITRNFFSGFPNEDKIISAVLKYKKNPIILYSIMTGFLYTIFKTKDSSVVERVTELMGKYEGNLLATIIGDIGIIANNTEDKDLVNSIDYMYLYRAKKNIGMWEGSINKLHPRDLMITIDPPNGD